MFRADIALGIKALVNRGADEPGMFARTIVAKRPGLKIAGFRLVNENMFMGGPVPAAFQVIFTTASARQHRPCHLDMIIFP